MLRPVERWDYPNYSYSSRKLSPAERSSVGVPSVTAVEDQKEISLFVRGHKLCLNASKEILDKALDVINTFEPLFELKDDWDSYGANSLKPDAFLTALSFILPLLTNAPSPRISLTKKGGVFLVYSHGGRDIELEIEGKDQKEAWLVDKIPGDSEEIEDFVSSDIIDILGL